PRQQDVIGRPLPALGALQHERELLAHPLLADELLEPPRPQCRFSQPLRLVGLRPGGTAGQLGGLVLLAHLAILARACFSRAGTSVSFASGCSDASATTTSSACDALQPSPVRASVSVSRHPAALEEDDVASPT